ncbi:hypothetical protein I8H83_01920 [Candidatus Saccharibacteria bacterium]|nr:hypothetical protein [Candidatus Saccharibacteria bacterium]
MATALNLAVFNPAIAATDGGLSSSGKLQVYNTSIRDGLDDYVTLYGPTVTADGYAYSYGAKQDNSLNILKFSPDKKLVKEFQLQDGYSLSLPTIAVDRHGNTYYAVEKELANNDRASAILKYNSNDQFVTVLDNFNTIGEQTIRGAYAVAIDSHDNLYVTAGASGGDSNIVLLKLDSAGNLLNKVDFLQGAEAHGYTQPLVVALNNKDQVYVAAMQPAGNETVKIFRVDDSGNIITTVGGDDPIKLGYGMNIDSNNNLYFISIDTTGNTPPIPGCPMPYEVRKYDSSGTFIGAIDTSPEASEGPVCTLYGGGASPAFSTAPGVGTDGDIYIGTGNYTDGSLGNARIAVYSMAKNIATFPPTGTQSNTQVRLSLPEGADLQYAEVKSQSELTTPTHVGFSYPLGLVSFKVKVKNTDPLSTELLFVTDLKPNEVTSMKYINGTYSPIANATIEQSTLEGKPALKLTYQLSDGGALDEDGIVNGEIVDPVGLAVKTTETNVLAPNTGSKRVDNGLPLFGIIATVLLAGVALIKKHKTSIK